MSSYQTNAPKNKLQQATHDVSSRSTQPADEQDRTSYGEISDVNDSNGQVKIRLFEGNPKGGAPTLGHEILEGAWIPLLNEPIEIVHKWGMLRRGLKVRVHYRGGRLKPNWAIAEVVGTENLNIFTKDPQSNMIDVGAYKVLSGGRW